MFRKSSPIKTASTFGCFFKEFDGTKTLILSVEDEVGIRTIIDEMLSALKNQNPGIRKVNLHHFILFLFLFFFLWLQNGNLKELTEGHSPGPDIVRIDKLREPFLDSVGGGAWPFYLY